MADLKKIAPRDRRIVKHIVAINEAGNDPEKFAGCIQAIRDDPTLSSAHRDAIFKTLAQDAAHAYVVFTTGKQFDFNAMIEAMPLED